RPRICARVEEGTGSAETVVGTERDRAEGHHDRWSHVVYGETERGRRDPALTVVGVNSYRQRSKFVRGRIRIRRPGPGASGATGLGNRTTGGCDRHVTAIDIRERAGVAGCVAFIHRDRGKRRRDRGRIVARGDRNRHRRRVAVGAAVVGLEGEAGRAVVVGGWGVAVGTGVVVGARHRGVRYGL